MKVAVVVFPGTNCEHDAVHGLKLVGADPHLVWHRETDLSEFDGIVLPGGFAHGDYLRTGAIGRFSPVMSEVERMAGEGAPVLGICNGFQILCESGLLPGALVQNTTLAFICRPVDMVVTSTDSVLTRAAEVGQVVRIPLNSYEGNYLPGEATPNVVLRYSTADGSVTEDSNPNGATDNIAGIANAAGNVAGLMPHPERAVEPILGSADGEILLASFAASMAHV